MHSPNILYGDAKRDLNSQHEGLQSAETVIIGPELNLTAACIQFVGSMIDYAGMCPEKNRLE